MKRGAPEKGPRGTLVCFYVVYFPWDTLRGDSFVFILVHPEKDRMTGKDLSVLCVVCPLVLWCQRKACLSTWCLSPGVLRGRHVSGVCRIV